MNIPPKHYLNIHYIKTFHQLFCNIWFGKSGLRILKHLFGITVLIF